MITFFYSFALAEHINLIFAPSSEMVWASRGPSQHMKGGMLLLLDESIPCAVDALKHNGLMVARERGTPKGLQIEGSNPLQSVCLSKSAAVAIGATRYRS